MSFWTRLGNTLGDVGSGIAGLLPGVSTLLQGRENRKLAEYQAQANERYLDKMNEYNTPANQMKRFQDAGLNPHLIYGQGSPGNQTQPLEYPKIETRDFSQLMSMIPAVNESRLANSQVQAIDAKTRHQGALTRLARLQSLVLERNPALDDPTYNAILENIKAQSEIAATTSQLKAGELKLQNATMGNIGRKIQHEADVLEEKFNLAKLDQQIKAEVLKSAKFKVEIDRINKEFIESGQMTPGLWLQWLQIIINKSL